MAVSKQESKSFSQSLQVLESLVNELKTGNLPLEKALERFETGVSLVQTCQNYLNETKGKVEILVKTLSQDNEIETEAFDTEDDDEDLEEEDD